MFLSHRDNRGFSLLELICVMAILSSILAVSAPALSGFFKGRSLYEESHRLLALTRYARSAALSEAAPAEIRIEVSGGTYGMTLQTPFETKDTQSREFQLADSLEFEADAEYIDEEGRVTILFHPDGLMDENNPEEIRVRDGNRTAIILRKMESGIGYILAQEEQ